MASRAAEVPGEETATPTEGEESMADDGSVISTTLDIDFTEWPYRYSVCVQYTKRELFLWLSHRTQH